LGRAVVELVGALEQVFDDFAHHIVRIFQVRS